MLWLLVLAVCAFALYSLSQGAPYVPTRRKQAEAALRLMDLSKGATIVDIGAGDGVVLHAAASQGYRAVGIELNPLLYLIARWRMRRFGARVKVIRGNAYKWHLPSGTKGVFFFTAGPFTTRLRRWLRAEQRRLGEPLVVVSLGFHLPDETVVKSAGGCVKYILK